MSLTTCCNQPLVDAEGIPADCSPVDCQVCYDRSRELCTNNTVSVPVGLDRLTIRVCPECAASRL